MLRINKKAKYFIIMVVVGLIIAQTAMLIYMMKSKAEFKDQIGKKQILLFTSYQDVEKSLFYIDMSARWAAEDAFAGAAYRGGFPDDTSCQRYLGFSLWELEEGGDEKCRPEGDTLNLAFTDSMNEILNDYFKKASDTSIPLDNYDISVTSLGEGKSLVTGAATMPISFDIKKGIVTPGVAYDVYTPVNTPAGPVGKGIKEKLQFVQDNYGSMIKKYTQQYGIPELESVIAGQIVHESSGKRYALGYSGEIGISQFTEPTARGYREIFGQVTPCGCIEVDKGSIDCKKHTAWSAELASQVGLKCNPENDGRFDPEKSINAQSKMMANLYNQYKKLGYTDDNALHLALHAYNRGPGTVDSQIKKVGGLSMVNQQGNWYLVAKAGQNPNYAKDIIANADSYKQITPQVNDAP